MPGTCETFRRPSNLGPAGSGWSVGSSGASVGSRASVPFPHIPNSADAGTNYDSKDGASGLVAAAHEGGGCTDSFEITLEMPQLLGEGMVVVTKDHDVGAADWLDATLALLDVVE